jgi:hypothetical protein
LNTAVKASDLPLSLLYAFSDALEAWSDLEHELFVLWQLLNCSPNIGKAWDQYSNWNSARQRENTRALVEKFRQKTEYAPRIPEVFDQL